MSRVPKVDVVRLFGSGTRPSHVYTSTSRFMSYRFCSECFYDSGLEKGSGLGIRRTPWGPALVCPPAGSRISNVIARPWRGDPPVLWHWALAQMLSSAPMPTSLFQQARAKLASFLSPKGQINLLPLSKISLPCFSLLRWNSSCILATHPLQVKGVVNTFPRFTA